jgi:hypothetical protein
MNKTTKMIFTCAVSAIVTAAAFALIFAQTTANAQGPAVTAVGRYQALKRLSAPFGAKLLAFSFPQSPRNVCILSSGN